LDPVGGFDHDQTEIGCTGKDDYIAGMKHRGRVAPSQSPGVSDAYCLINVGKDKS
jgi:hypothetical protein